MFECVAWVNIALLIQNYYIYYFYSIVSWITFKEICSTQVLKFDSHTPLQESKRWRRGCLHTWVSILVLSYHFPVSLVALSIPLLLCEVEIRALIICSGFWWGVEVTCIKDHSRHSINYSDNNNNNSYNHHYHLYI